MKDKIRLYRVKKIIFTYLALILTKKPPRKKLK